MSQSRLTFDQANRNVSYNPKTGEIHWLVSKGNCGNGCKAGDLAGYYGKRYVEIRIDGILCYGHRIAWLLSHKEHPVKGMCIDHKNRNMHDNRLSNLRCVQFRSNVINRVSHKYRGVCFCKQTGMWKATTSFMRKQIWLGRFETRNDALQARLKFEADHMKNEIIPR